MMKRVFILLTVVCVCFSCCTAFARSSNSPYGDIQILRNEWFNYGELYSTAENRAIATWLAALEVDLDYGYTAVDPCGESYVGYLSGTLYVAFPNPNSSSDSSHCYLTIGFMDNNRYVLMTGEDPFPHNSHIQNDVETMESVLGTVEEIIDYLFD